jgi:hypothetical protein
MIRILLALLLYPFLKLRNPKGRRDRKGKVIDDHARRKHSAEVRRKIESGEIVLPGRKGGPRCYKITSRSSLDLHTSVGS